MFTTSKYRTLAMALSVAVVTGCASGMLGITYVPRRPPPDRVEVIGTAPASNEVWVGGHWMWTHDDYEWQPGHWQRIENGQHEWVRGHWQEDRQGWFWVDGHWR